MMKSMTEHNSTESTPKKWKGLFLAALAEHGNVSRAARSARIHRTLAYQQRAVDAEFAKAWQDAQSQGLDSLEDVANVRARKDSDTLLIFLLKAHRPEKYRDRYEISGPNGGPIQTQQVFDHSAAVATITARSIAYRESLSADEGDSDGETMG